MATSQVVYLAVGTTVAVACLRNLPVGRWSLRSAYLETFGPLSPLGHSQSGSFITLAAFSGKRNLTVRHPSIRPSIRPSLCLF